MASVSLREQLAHTNVPTKRSMEPLTVLFKGEAITPTFELDVEELHLGRVAYGFDAPSRMTFRNTSHVPITFSLRVPEVCQCAVLSCP